MATHSTRFVILAGRHPAALLAGDEDLEKLKESITDAIGARGIDWLLWLGEEIPAAVSRWTSGDNTIRLRKASPATVGPTLRRIGKESGRLKSLVHLKVVVTAPLIFWNREWWAVGTPGKAKLDASESDGYVFHLPTLLREVMPSRRSTTVTKVPQVVRHVVFHEYRLWGSGAEQLPLDVPDEVDFDAFRRDDLLKDIQFERHADPEWTPALERPPHPVPRGPKDRVRRSRVLKEHRCLGSRPGAPCLIGSGRDYLGWSLKLKLLLRALGIPRVHVVSYELPIPNSRPGLVALLRAEALDLSAIDHWVAALPREVPICVLDDDAEETEGLEQWCVDGRCGEAMVVDQALMIARMAKDQQIEEWNLSEAVADLRDALFPDGDLRLESIWHKIREHFGAVQVDEATDDPIALGESIERLLKHDARELPRVVVRAYEETGQLFEGEGRDLHIRSTPKACLKILGTLDPGVRLVEQPLPADPTLSVHVSDTILAEELHKRWLNVSGRILEGETR